MNLLRLIVIVCLRHSETILLLSRFYVKKEKMSFPYPHERNNNGTTFTQTIRTNTRFELYKVTIDLNPLGSCDTLFG